MSTLLSNLLISGIILRIIWHRHWVEIICACVAILIIAALVLKGRK